MIKISKKAVVGILTFIILSVAIYMLNQQGVFAKLDAKSIKDYIGSFGNLAPIIYIVMFSLIPLTLFPDSILAIAGGMAFGLVWGTVYILLLEQ